MQLDSLKIGLRNTDVDAYLVTDIKNVYYFTGFKDISGSTLNLLVTLNDDPILIVSPLSFADAKDNAKNCIVKEGPRDGKIIDQLIKELREQKVNSVHFDKLQSKTYLELVKRVDIKFIPNPMLVDGLRRIKSETELAYIRKAAELADIGIETGVESIKPGVKEYEVAAEIEYSMRIKGSEGTAFETVVASGPRSAYPHGLSSDKVIKKGEFVIIDLGAVYAGYCSDITRTVVAGKLSAKQQRILNLVSRAQEEAFQNIRAGAKAKDIDDIARKILAESKYGKYFIHGLGHGVGLDIHEPPILSPISEDFLETGNVVTDEPGVYFPGIGGVRIEDMVLVQQNRGERLTFASYYL